MFNLIRKSCFYNIQILFTNNILNHSIPLAKLSGENQSSAFYYIFRSKYSKLMSTCANISTDSKPVNFSPKKALLLCKFSRYDFEKHRNPDLSEDELIESIERRGSDYKSLIYHHKIHIKNRDHIVECLDSKNIETKVINRLSYNEDDIDWADMVITSGGDGTFLMAASKIRNNMKPLIGVNSDPTRSVGYLLLPKKYSNNFDKALDCMLNNKFEWQFRQRIRITLESENSYDDPIELHDQQLLHPEYRFLELDKTSHKKVSKSYKKRFLPFRALNEVFVGESLSSRVSYFELTVNDSEKAKIKSSGLTICTGTGSTSWSFNINKLTPQCVHNLFKIINKECFSENKLIAENDQELIHKVTNKFNNSLIYSPSQLLMAYTIRDPVVFGTRFQNNPRDFAKKITVKSRMTDASIVIDGGLSYKFNDGSNATFEMFEEDALRTIKLIE